MSRKTPDWKILFRIIALIFLSVIASHASAKPGFQPIKSGLAPQSIVEASQNVFEFWSSGNIQKVDRSKYIELEKKLSKAKPTSFRQKMAFAVAKAEIARCRKLDLRTCSVSSEPARGSAFFVEGGRMVTVAHNFAPDSALLPFFADLQENWNDLLASRDPLNAAKVSEAVKSFSSNPLKDAIFFLTDREQQLVFSSLTHQYQFMHWRELGSPKASVEIICAKAGDNCKIKQIVFESNSTAKPSALLPDYRSLFNDVAILRLDAKHGIALANARCTVGEQTFIVGYPAKTSNRRQNGFRDAADREMVFTEGSTIAVNTLDQLSAWSGIRGLIGFFQGRKVLFSDADGWPGMSGGVILNREGKACAVYVGSSPMGGQLELNVQSARHNLFSFGVPLVE